MPTVRRSLIVPYSAHEMYALAGDVDRYHEFLPWCSESVTLRDDGSETLARVGIAYKGWNTTFTTRNRAVADQSIQMRLAEGVAFESLSGDWQFEILDNMACRVELKVSFALAGRLGGKMLGPIFSRICTEMIDAFAERAKQLYGERAFA